MSSQPTLLLVANWDSNVGYAWWLMESFWAKLAEHYSPYARVVLAYPSISTLPDTIAQAPLETVEQDFSGTNPRQIIQQCQFLKANKVKIIYFSDRPTWHWRYIFFRLFGVQVIVVHDHTPGVRTPATGLKGLAKRFIHRLPLLSADGAIGASQFVRERLIQVNGMPPKRCFAAPNGLPDRSSSVLAADLHELFGIPSMRKVLVMASRANRYKGVDFALVTVSRMLDQGRTDLHFLFIGDGPDLDDFKESAQRLGVDDHCTFTGKRSDVDSLLAGADVAFHPSKGEVGYSLSILEYMRAGLPVVVPDNPSVCQATEHGITGAIYPQGNVQAASESLLQLLNDDALRAEQGEQARKVAARFTLRSTHNALIQAFEKISPFAYKNKSSLTHAKLK